MYGSNGIVGRHSSAITDGPTIVIGRKGSFGEVSYSPEPAWPIDTAYYVDGTATSADLKWLSHRLTRLGLTDLNKSAAVPGLNREDAYRQKLLLPPLDEQRRIAAILDQADALRAKRRQVLAHLDSLTQSIFHDMFGSVHASSALSHFVEEFRYGTSNKSGDGGWPTLRIPNVVSGAIDTREIKTVNVTDAELRRLALCDGDLLFVRTNGNPDNVGRCAVFRQEAVSRNRPAAETWIFASYLIRARLGDDVNPAFISAYLASPTGRRHLRDRSKTSAGQYNINTEGLASVPVLDVGLAEQTRFASRAAAISEYQTMVRRSLAANDELFASLQSRAFRGEL